MVTGLCYSERIEIMGEKTTKWKNRLHDEYFESNRHIKFEDLAKGFKKMFEKYEKVKVAARKGKKKRRARLKNR